MHTRFARLLVLTVTFGVAVIATTLARGLTEETYPSLGLLNEVLGDIETQYVTEVPPAQLIHSAAVGLLDDLDGKSELLAPRGRRGDADQAADPGLVIRRRKETLTVVTPVDGTAAHRAGVMAGDQILKIDGLDARTMEPADAAGRLRGPATSTVVVSIMRQGWAEPRDFTLTREPPAGPTVSVRQLREGVLYLRIHRFAAATSTELTAALASAGGRGLVLDLRNDAGGSVLDAVDLAQRFLEPGQLVAYSQGRRPDRQHEFRASPSAGRFTGLVVALVNQGSGAAAEIAAGALHDWGRAVLVGTRTAGEASVQSTIPLPDGSAVLLTTARYFTPRGHVIDGTGLPPDVEAVTTADADTQLARALEVLTIERTLQKRESGVRASLK